MSGSVEPIDRPAGMTRTQWRSLLRAQEKGGSQQRFGGAAPTFASGQDVRRHQYLRVNGLPHHEKVADIKLLPRDRESKRMPWELAALFAWKLLLSKQKSKTSGPAIANCDSVAA
jgi:hypothetical protein